MKTLILTSALLLLMRIMPAHGINDPKYLDAMQKNIQMVYRAQTPDALQQAVNVFERIGETEKNKWEPYYYAAFGYIMMMRMEKEDTKKDAQLDKALSLVEKAKRILPEDSEIVALEGFVHMMRVTIDPRSRGQQYGSLATQLMEKATMLNPENPRAHALLAQMQYGKAQFYGASTADACERLQKALVNFETYTSENPLAPQWGRKMAEGLKAQCK